MSAMQKVKDALLKAGFSGEKSRECAEGGEKTPRSPHVAMDFVRRALDSAAPWWQTQGAAPKDGERIVNSPVEKETKPSALGAGRHMEAMQRKEGSRPPIGKLPDTPKGMDEALVMDGMAMDAGEMASAATQMMSELEKHDKQHHPGGYKGGTCKLRDKVAQAAKNIGMSPKAVEKITKRTSGAEGEGTPAPEAPSPDDSPEFKEFYELRQKIMDDTRAANEGKTEEEQKQNVKAAIKKLHSARFDYLTKALKMSPAEAGACSEIAEKVESGSEVAKQVVEDLPKEQKEIIDAVTAKEVAAEPPDSSEGIGQAETPSGAQSGDDPDAKFASELKDIAPEHAEMVDTLTAKFDGLNTALTEEQKKQFWELNEGGDEGAFYKFLGAVGKFAPEEVDALRALTDAYREANPDQYPEYAKQHQYDKLRREVFKKDHRLKSALAGSGSKKPLSAQGLADYLVGKGLDKDSIVAFMKSEGIDEELATAIVNGDPVDPELDLKEAERIAEKDKLAKKRAELSKAEFDSKERYNRAKDKAEKDRKRGDPDTEKKLKKLYDKWKAARDANAAFKQNPTLEPAAAPAPVQAPAPEPPTESQPQAESQAPAPAPAQSHAATKEDVAKQSADDPVEEGDTPEDHAKVCKANPKSNCPFLKAHMTKEQRAALDNPQKAEGAAPADTIGEAPAPSAKPPAPSTEKQKQPRPEAADVLYMLNGDKKEISEEVKQQMRDFGYSDDDIQKAIEAQSSKIAPAEPSASTESLDPPPLPISPEPLPEYKPPKIGGSEMPLEDGEKQTLEALKQAYLDAPSGEVREAAKQMYENYCSGLDRKAAMMQAAHDIEADENAQAEEKKRPGFIQNIKNFFSGIAKSMRGDDFVDLSDTMRDYLGLPKDRNIRRSELQDALARKDAEEKRKDEDQKAAAEAEKNAPDWNKNGGVKSSSGNQPEVVNDSFLDRSQAKEGGLKNKEEAMNKIKDVLTKAGIGTDGLKDRAGPSDTTFSIKTKKLSPKEVEDLEGEIVRALDRWDGKGDSKVKVSYNKQSFMLKVMVPHEDDERGDLPFAKVFDSDAWKNKTKDMEIPLMFGEDENGKPVIADLADLVHLLVAGSTGSGKSSRMNTALVSMLMSRSPDQLGVWMIDPKRAEFTAYEHDKHLLGDVAYSVEEADRTLKEATEEAEKRRKLLQAVTRETGQTIPDLKTYNKLAKEGKIPKQYPQFIKPAVVIIDEYSQLSDDGGKDINKKIAELARLSRATGPHVIIATQRPDSKTIDGQIRSNLPSQLGLNTRSRHESDMIFGEPGVGAEHLAQKGPFILKTPKGDIVKGNGAHLSNEELDGYHREDSKINNAPTVDKNGTSSSATSSRSFIPSSPTHIDTMQDGVEIHKSPDGKFFFMRDGRQYKRARGYRKDGSMVEGWKLADGSDPRIYLFNVPTPAPRT